MSDNSQPSRVPALPSDAAERVGVYRAHVVAGHREQAEYAARKVPASAQGHPSFLAAHGIYLCKAGRAEQGLQTLSRAATLDPDDVEVVCDFAEMLWTFGHRQQAIDVLLDLDKRHPVRARTLFLLADYAYRSNYVPLAYQFAEKLVTLDPGHFNSLYMMAYRKADLRQYDESLELFRRAAAAAPADPRAVQGGVMTMLYCGADPLEVRRATEAWVHAAWGDALAHPGTCKPAKLPGPGNKLRIAYLSGDFRNHVVTHFFRDLVRRHDRSRVHVTCYSNVEHPDPYTEEIASLADAFRDVRKLPDVQLADIIRADNIDVLIDLGGHTDHSRLSVFARRCAPVQVSYLGYAATTGVPNVDYRITDADADPVGAVGGTDAFCTEKLFRLPRCAWAFNPMYEGDWDVATDPPAFEKPEAGGMFTFGSFNLMTKVSQSSTALWAKALAASGEKARILMTDRRGLTSDTEGVQILRQEFLDGGADVNRVLLATWVPDHRVQRRRLREVDLMLDPLSYNGTTTTCEALWHGVPVLTLPGKSHVSRVGASLLKAVGLPEFIARDEADYVAKAAALAADPSPLKALRHTLRDRFKASPLHDHKSLARALEVAYFTMTEQRSRA